jgi:Carboxypeptidase regulatory-like domain
MIYRAISVACFFALFFGTRADCQNYQIQLEKTLTSQTLSGRVRFDTDPTGVEGALVELCDAEWKKMIASTTTDSEGAFSFPGFKANKTYYLRLSMRNYHTLLVKVKLKPSGPKELILNLRNAT